MEKISLLLVDDHPVVRQGLRAFLSQEKDMEVVGEAENGRQAVQMATKTMPDIVIMDLMMPFLNGWEGTRQVLKNVPSTKVLVLSSYSDDAFVQRLMNVGASGYLVKQTAADNLLLAIREVQKGNTFFSPALANACGGMPATDLARNRGAATDCRGVAQPANRRGIGDLHQDGGAASAANDEEAQYS